MDKQQENKRFEWIDFLKGFAATLVILAHFWEICKKKYGYIGNENLIFQVLDNITINYIDIGKIAVTLFFIISGYLTANTFKKKSRKQFICDRCKRMYPLYWFSIILSLILIRTEPISKIIINLSMFQQFVGVENIIGASWTLQIDIIFYCVCIFLVTIKVFENKKYINLSYYAFLLLSLIMGIFRFYTEKNFPIAIGILLSATFIGIMLKRNENNQKEEKYNLKLNIALFFITLFPTVMLSYTDKFTNIQIGFRYFNTYVLAFIIFFIGKKLIKKEKIFSKLGKCSYSLYLLHPTIGVFTLNKLYYFNVNIIINIILSYIVTIICSKITYKYIENIFTNNKKKNEENQTIYINGRFLTQKITGVQRYAIEVTKQLEKQNSDEYKFIILAPKKNIIQNIELKNIQIKKIGKFKGYLWEQLSLPLYILLHNKKAKLLNMCNVAPILYPRIYCNS